jgi:hypothetical protein
MNRHKRWVVCSVCHRKYVADGNTDYPKKHNTPPERIVFGEVSYLVNPPWATDKEICKGSYKKGEVLPTK